MYSVFPWMCVNVWIDLKYSQIFWIIIIIYETDILSHERIRNVNNFPKLYRGKQKGALYAITFHVYGWTSAGLICCCEFEIRNRIPRLCSIRHVSFPNGRKSSVCTWSHTYPTLLWINIILNIILFANGKIGVIIIMMPYAVYHKNIVNNRVIYSKSNIFVRSLGKCEEDDNFIQFIWNRTFYVQNLN